MLHYYDHYLKDGAPSILLQDDNFAGVRAVVNHGVIVIPATEIKKLQHSQRAFTDQFLLIANECALQRSPQFIFDKL